MVKKMMGNRRGGKLRKMNTGLASEETRKVQLE
jgi:hypothetical protein